MAPRLYGTQIWWLDSIAEYMGCTHENFAISFLAVPDSLFCFFFLPPLSMGLSTVLGVSAPRNGMPYFSDQKKWCSTKPSCGIVWSQVPTHNLPFTMKCTGTTGSEETLCSVMSPHSNSWMVGGPHRASFIRD